MHNPAGVGGAAPRLSVEDFPQELRRAYEVVCPLGSGSFGDVFRAKLRRPKPASFPVDVAIKIIPVPGDRVNKQLQVELINHFKCFYPHVVTALDIIFMPMRVAIVMELVPGGDMFKMVERSRHGLPEDKVRWIFQQLVLGVFYLHKLGIAQRDIKLENLLVVDPRLERPKVKITDFGYSKDSRESQCESRVGTCSYMAPEVFRGGTNDRQYDGKKADMWSCGIMLYVMLFARYPFKLDTRNQAQFERELRRMIRGGYELPERPRISGLCQDLLQHLITPNPYERFSAAQCLRHDWFQQGLPPTAIAEALDFLKQTEDRWSSGRRRKFEKKMRRRTGGSRGLGCWGLTRSKSI